MARGEGSNFLRTPGAEEIRRDTWLVTGSARRCDGAALRDRHGVVARVRVRRHAGRSRHTRCNARGHAPGNGPGRRGLRCADCVYRDGNPAVRSGEGATVSWRRAAPRTVQVLPRGCGPPCAAYTFALR